MIGKVICGEAIETMKSIPDKAIDMILCDLPYGTTACSWDTIIPFEPLWESYKRIIKDNGAIVLTASQPFTSALVMSNPDMFKYCWYWKKERLTNPLISHYMPGKVIEDICVFYKNLPTYNPIRTKYFGKLVTNNAKGNHGETTSKTTKVTNYKDDGSRSPIQLLEFKRDVRTLNLHPTQKPVALFEYLIKTYTNENDLVLDNCCGSGTTGRACKNLNRRFIEIELDPTYARIAEERLKQGVLNF